MNNLATIEKCLPAMSVEAVDMVRRLEEITMKMPQADIETTHVLHAGMYARTIMIPESVLITGVLIKIATILIVNGDCTAYVGDSAIHLNGHNVLRGSAGRKQVFVARSDTWLTMMFPTNAKTVEEAEAQFTDETHLLYSRRLNDGGRACLE